MDSKVYLEDAVNEKAIEAGEKRIVFLIGDSIRMGYCHTVREELKDIAEVVFPEENCKFSQNIITSLNAWAGLCDPDKVALVQFNCGHWDVAHWGGEEVSLNSIPVYQENICRIIKKLKMTFPNAKIIFATTTPMNPDGTIGKNPRTTEEIMAYNRAAAEATEESGVPVNDLFAVTKNWPSSCYRDYCHYTQEYAAVLGRHVAQFIRAKL